MGLVNWISPTWNDVFHIGVVGYELIPSIDWKGRLFAMECPL